ncbi:SUMO-activating enzyme subunit 1 [Myotis davidii]|uniref:SUMO-activating enzyme subunit 1 n=1 Tax=Myotis davidii TaxID=225400 RepID=L5LDR0_MYODS|nr:SUMO-activating enzyme subunit 1 [Myotis davidii]
MVEKEEAGGGISEEEAAQYDRQIRLWGLEAQKRLRASRVLLVGTKGLGAEIAKNLILAGVKGLTMLDHEQGQSGGAKTEGSGPERRPGSRVPEENRCRQPGKGKAYCMNLFVQRASSFKIKGLQVSPEDLGAQFLIRPGSLGRNRAEACLERAQNLNPMVEVKVDTENIEKKPESFFTQFDAVCLTCCSRDVIIKVDQICHKNSIKFFTGDVFGYHGYTFANLGEHEFVEEKTKVAKVSQGVEDGPDTKRAKLDSSETTMVKKTLPLCGLTASAVEGLGQDFATLYRQVSSVLADTPLREMVDATAQQTLSWALHLKEPSFPESTVECVFSVNPAPKVVFCSIKEALEVDWSSDKAKAALKRTTSDYFLLQGLEAQCTIGAGKGPWEGSRVCPARLAQSQSARPQQQTNYLSERLPPGVLLKFRTDKGRDPSCDTFGEDSELLLQIRNDVLDSLGVNPDLLPEDFVRFCFSEMAPVCAVVGGVLAQEIVKALSQRDPPHNNFFFFDGMKGNGIVECLGPK